MHSPTYVCAHLMVSNFWDCGIPPIQSLSWRAVAYTFMIIIVKVEWR